MTTQPREESTPPMRHTPRGIAADLVVDGLLRHLGARDKAASERRVGRVLAALAPAALRFPARRIVRWAAAAAALVAIVAAFHFMGVPGETTALAELQRAAAAMREPGDRRYEVRVFDWNGGESRSQPDTIDTRSPGGLLLIQHQPPWEKSPITCGRDADGKWSIRDGAVERRGADRDWPPWATLDGESLFDDSVDKLLDALPRTYSLERLAAGAVEAGGRLYDRVSAVRIRKDGPRPHRVDLWIDPGTRMVERIEFRWDNAGTSEHESGPPHGTGKRGGHGPGGPREQGGDDHGPPLDDGGGPPDGTPPADMGDDQRGSDHGPRDHHGPGGPGGPPDHGNDGGHSSPGHPKLVSFQRIDAPTFARDWFDPNSHNKK